jgi:hypothetical protein
MKAGIKFIIGLIGLLLITFMTMAFGVGGFFFTLALFGIGVWAFGK